MFRLMILRSDPLNGGLCFWNSGGNKSRGVGIQIVYNVSLDFEDLEVRRDFDGRLINLKLSLHDWQFQIMCIYAPNDSIRVFLRLVETHVPPDSFNSGK